MELHDPIEETLDEIALTIEPGRKAEALLAVGAVGMSAQIFLAAAASRMAVLSVRHPGRIRGLVLYGGYAAGWRARGEVRELTKREAMMTLTRDGWGQNNPAFRQMYTTLFFPEASQTEMDWFNELQRMTTSPRNAELLSEAFARMDSIAAGARRGPYARYACARGCSSPLFGW